MIFLLFGKDRLFEFVFVFQWYQTEADTDEPRMKSQYSILTDLRWLEKQESHQNHDNFWLFTRQHFFISTGALQGMKNESFIHLCFKGNES